jgi:hypothetical protein
LLKRLIKAILPTIITSIILFFNLIYPSIVAGGILYSILVDTIPGHSKKAIFWSYLLHCIIYPILGVIVWLLQTLIIYNELNFSDLTLPAFFSLMYYHILLFINQFTD